MTDIFETAAFVVTGIAWVTFCVYGIRKNVRFR